MSEPKKSLIKNIGVYIATVLAVIGYLMLGYAVEVTIHPPVEEKVVEAEVDSSLVLSDTQPETPVEVVEDGEAKTIDVVTVDEVDGGEIPTENDGKTEEELNVGRGAYYDASSGKAWVDSTYGHCIDVDGYFGAQCADYFAAFVFQQYGYWPSTNGTGAARGYFDEAVREYNAGGECGEIINGRQRCKNMTIVYDLGSLQINAWGIYNGGQWGHVGIHYSLPVNGYTLLVGQNQGGAACAGGGAAVNIINMSTTTWRGAYIPNEWLEPEPEPAPEPAVEGAYYYVEGDTFGRVILDLGYATENGLWGPNGDVQYYNAQLLEQGILNYYDGKYWNNIPVGTEIKLERRAE